MNAGYCLVSMLPREGFRRRGDAPGFVQVLNDKTLVVPERPGNKRLDSIINIVNQPQLALIL